MAAAHNLAVIEIRHGNYRPALERLRSVVRRLDLNPELDQSWPTLRPACEYSIGLAYAYLGFA